MIRFLRALATTAFQCVGLQRIADKLDPVLDKAQQSQAIKTPNCTATHPPQNGVKKS